MEGRNVVLNPVPSHNRLDFAYIRFGTQRYHTMRILMLIHWIKFVQCFFSLEFASACIALPFILSAKLWRNAGGKRSYGLEVVFIYRFTAKFNVNFRFTVYPHG